MYLMMNGSGQLVATLDDLRGHLNSILNAHDAEICLSESSMPGDDALFLLKSGDRAWLMYMPGDEDPASLSSRDPDYQGAPSAALKFVLTNGQMDEYPESWTLPAETAVRALEYYFTRGTLAPWIVWHDDSVPDDAR